jgi:hypothetical protein
MNQRAFQKTRRIPPLLHQGLRCNFEMPPSFSWLPYYRRRHPLLPPQASTTADVAEPVRALIDPQGRGRRSAARRTQLVGTRTGGFRLTRQKVAGKWGAATTPCAGPDRRWWLRTPRERGVSLSDLWARADDLPVDLARAHWGEPWAALCTAHSARGGALRTSPVTVRRGERWRRLRDDLERSGANAAGGGPTFPV